MGVWSKIGKGALIGGAGLATIGTMGAASPALAAALGGIGLTSGGAAALGAGLGAAGSGLGAASNAAAKNRGEKFAGQYDLERLLMDRERMAMDADTNFNSQTIAREQEGRASGSDAWRKLLASQRTLNPGPRPQLSPYSVAPRQATDAERSGASAMEQEVMARLQGGNPIQAPTRRAPMPAPSIDPSLLKAGKGESIMGWLAPLLAAAGQQSQQGPPILSSRNPATTQAALWQAPRARG